MIFFQCPKCGFWYYAAAETKTKKCVKCRRNFSLGSVMKLTRECSPRDAIKIIQELKEDEAFK